MCASMNKSPRKNTYDQLMKDITELYDHARFAYWQIGKRIVEQEQQGDDTPEYGARLLERLFEDLQHKLGSGFSVRNLRKMRRFYLNNRNRPAPADLTWTQHVELLPVTNKADKRRLERRIISDKLSPRQIRSCWGIALLNCSQNACNIAHIHSLNIFVVIHRLRRFQGPFVCHRGHRVHREKLECRTLSEDL